MKTWRIGSNWDNENILSIFKKYNIAFAGKEVEYRMKELNVNDLIAITNGQSIVAIGKIKGLIPLKSIKEELVDNYQDVTAIQMEPLYFSENYDIEFGYYDGQGKQFHEAQDNYKIHIRNIYNTLNKVQMRKDIIKLLEYKKQIILQGPPGTGKTRMAKEIAKEITKPKIIGSPTNKINDFLKNYNSTKPDIVKKREDLKTLLEEFHSKFPKEKLNELTLEEYAFGRGDNETFCYWLEYKLWEHGLYSGFAQKFLIYYKKEIGEYSKHGFLKELSDEEAMSKLASMLYVLANNIDLETPLKHLGNGLILKVLYTYNPDVYFPINNENCINNGLRLLGFEWTKLNLIDKSKKLQELFIERRKQFNADITNLEFMRYLFDNFDMKGYISIQSDEVVSLGEFKLIQFHPAYSYEDFVRGIIAETNKIGHVEYKVSNKILAEFAQNALDNPSANYVLIIDEINRANLPAVLGELIYTLEYRFDEENPKETTVQSMYVLKADRDDEEGSRELKLPNNLYIIGTMNTADRSVGHIDYAIRRRFAFVDIFPTKTAIDDVVKDQILNKKAKDLFAKVTALFYEKYDDNDNTTVYLQADFKSKDVQLGHSYFLAETEEHLQMKLQYEIKPLLNEYVKDGILSNNALTEIEKL